MKSFFYTSDGRFRGLRLAAVVYLFDAPLAFIWGHSFAWGTGWLLMALSFLAMSQGEEAPGSKWRSPIYLAGFATSNCRSRFPVRLANSKSADLSSSEHRRRFCGCTTGYYRRLDAQHGEPGPK